MSWYLASPQLQYGCYPARTQRGQVGPSAVVWHHSRSPSIVDPQPNYGCYQGRTQQGHLPQGTLKPLVISKEPSIPLQFRNFILVVLRGNYLNPFNYISIICFSCSPVFYLHPGGEATLERQCLDQWHDHQGPALH